MFDVLFKIFYVCHGETNLLQELIPRNMRIFKQTELSHEVTFIIDGYETSDYKGITDLAFANGADEVRLRSRRNNCASGDVANNGHYHYFNTRSKYIIAIEDDIAIFPTVANFNLLDELFHSLERAPELCLATKIDDSDCWVWKMKSVGADLGEGIMSVNRLASHFVIYNTINCVPYLFGGKNPLSITGFRNIEEDWYNYEDYLSYTFAQPDGPGIGFLNRINCKVFHCDRKLAVGSPHYTQNIDEKIKVYHGLVDEYGEVNY